MTVKKITQIKVLPGLKFPIILNKGVYGAQCHGCADLFVLTSVYFDWYASDW